VYLQLECQPRSVQSGRHEEIIKSLFHEEGELHANETNRKREQHDTKPLLPQPHAAPCLARLAAVRGGVAIRNVC
jgi:hypothetical protein